MDVRCEKCQTEYELDEARLKPGGVTVKCTNCGHMFKIRKRSNTNVGAAAPEPRAKPPSKPAATHPAQPQQTAAGPGFAGKQPRADSMLDDAPTKLLDGDGPTVERQWLIRTENGEQKSCRELATLQQWIIAGVVTRESLISRSGKTWKRIGDIAELVSYFDIADEARTTRNNADNRKPPSKPPIPGTMLGVGGPTAAGGTILPDDDEQRTTQQRRALSTPPPVPRVQTKTPPLGAPTSTQAPTTPPPTRRPITTPPPPPPKKEPSAPSALPAPTGNRATAAWASDQIKPEAKNDGAGTRPFGGKISAIPDEPAFAAGRVRAAPSSEHSFDTDRVRMPARDDDEDVLPRRKGSSAGLWILLVVLLVGAGTTAALYFFVFKKDEPVAKAPADAPTVAQVDAAPVVTPLIDAPAPPVSPLEAARHELWADTEARLQTSYDGLAGKDEPDALALRSQLGTAIAQAMMDRAGLLGDKSEAEKLRKQAKTIVLEAATMAQKAHKATPDDPSANVAYAAVLRLQNKPAKDVRRFLDVAKAKAGDWSRDVSLGEALLFAREGKLDDAKTAFAAIDSGDGKLETSNDVRARFHLALLAFAQGKPADAKPLVDQVLAAQPDHAGAKALSAKLENLVAKTDPLPPEDPKNGSGSAKPGSGSAVTVGSGTGSAGPTTRPPDNGGGKDDYDGYVKKADAVADSNCTKANELYSKALELKPNGVEALTGQGYCALEAKNFSTAHRKFSTALATAPRYEPALAGIAETYTLQGRKEDAISAWRRYLEAFPGSAKAQKALDRLGANAGTPTPPPSNPGGSGSTPGSDAPPPTPTPTPTPAGSGSG